MLQQPMLTIVHTDKMTGNQGDCCLYYFLQKQLNWPLIIMNCYEASRNCSFCARNRLRLYKHRIEVELFHARPPQEFLAIEILNEHTETPLRNKYLLVIMKWFSKLVEAVSFSSITAEAAAKTFDTRWVLPYGAPFWLLSDNEPKFTASSSQHVCRSLRIENLFTTSYLAQFNAKVEQFNCTIPSGLRH